MPGHLPQELNAFGELVEEMLEKRGMDRSELVREMVRAGWNVNNPKDALKYASHKTAPNLDFSMLCFFAAALDLDDDEEEEILVNAYRAQKGQETIRGNAQNGASTMIPSFVS